MVLISPPSIEEWWQNTAWLFIPPFSANSHSSKTSLKWQLVQRDSERDGKLHRTNSMNRNQNIPWYEKVFLPIIITAATSEAQDKRFFFLKSKAASGGFAPMWNAGVGRGRVTDVSLDTVREGSEKWKVSEASKGASQSNVVSISVHYWNALCNCSAPPVLQSPPLL